MLARKAGVPVSSVTRMTIWGNHSDTQYPDYKNARIGDDCVLSPEGKADGEYLDGVIIIRDGVLVVPKGAVLAPGTTI